MRQADCKVIGVQECSNAGTFCPCQCPASGGGIFPSWFLFPATEQYQDQAHCQPLLPITVMLKWQGCWHDFDDSIMLRLRLQAS